MANLRRATLGIGVADIGIGIVVAEGWLRRSTTVLTELQWDRGALDAPGPQFEPVFSTLAGRKAVVRVVLADPLARFFVVTPPVGARQPGDLRAAAAMRFSALFGEPIDDWQIDGDWHARQAFLACAVPTRLLKDIGASALRHRLPLASITPAFIAAWNRGRHAVAAGDWFATVCGMRLTFAVVSSSGPAMVRTISVPPTGSASQTELVRMLQQEALRQGVPAPRRLVLDGDVPAAWLQPRASSGIDVMYLEQGRTPAAGGALWLAYLGATS